MKEQVFDITRYKYDQLKLLSDYRKQLYHNPKLKFFFLELTLRCNERCLHCGSDCTAQGGEELSLDQYKKILDDMKRDFDIDTL